MSAQAGMFRLGMLMDDAIREVANEQFDTPRKRRIAKRKARQLINNYPTAVMFSLRYEIDNAVDELEEARPELFSDLPAIVSEAEGDTPFLDWLSNLFEWMRENEILKKIFEVIKDFIAFLFEIIGTV